MLNGYRIVACVPAGRRARLAALLMHLRAQRPLLDAVHLWRNTDDPDDLAYIDSCADEFVTVVPLDEREPSRSPKQLNTGRFYRLEDADDTVFIRFDDDIVWLAPDAIERLATYRLAHREPLVVFANIVNNAVCAYYQQQAGALDPTVELTRYCMDRIGWQDPGWGIYTHEAFLDAIRDGTTGRFRFPHQVLDDALRFSVSTFAWLSDDYDTVWGSDELWRSEEEHWITGIYPPRVGRWNHICGDALVSHLTFFTQKQAIEATNIPDRYMALARDAQHDAYYRLLALHE